LTEQDYEILAKTKEMRITNLMVNNPCLLFGVSFLFLSVITLMAFSYDMFMINEISGRDYYLWDHPIVFDHDKRTVAEKAFKENTSKGNHVERL
jgi:hypothetical protein